MLITLFVGHLVRAGEPEPEPLEKKTRSRSRSRLEKKSGARATKKLAGSSALCENLKSIRKLYFSYSFLWLKKQLFYLFHIFCSFTLLVCGEKNILPNLTKSQEAEPVGAGCFWLLLAGDGATWKKTVAGAGAAWEKNQEPEPEPLEKKVMSRSRSR